MYRKLRYIRENNNIIQKDVAKILNLSKSQYCLYETESVTIPIKYLIVLANYFNVSLDYIFEFTDTMQYKNSSSEINREIISKRLKEFRKENKLTQTDLANILNTSFTTISSYERGVNLISTNYIYTICREFNISADYILGKIDNPKYLK